MRDFSKEQRKHKFKATQKAKTSKMTNLKEIILKHTSELGTNNLLSLFRHTQKKEKMRKSLLVRKFATKTRQINPISQEKIFENAKKELDRTIVQIHQSNKLLEKQKKSKKFLLSKSFSTTKHKKRTKIGGFMERNCSLAESTNGIDFESRKKA